MKILTLRTYLLLVALLTLGGMLLFYSMIREGLTGAQKLTKDETLVLNMLDNLEKLNGALVLIEKNESPSTLSANHSTSGEIRQGYAIADSALQSIDSLANSQFFNRADVENLELLFRQKIDISKKVVTLSEAGKITEALTLLQKQRDDGVVTEYLRKYNQLFLAGRKYVLGFQEKHINSSARDFNIVKLYCLLVFCGLLYILWQSLKNLNNQEKLINENKTYRNIIEQSHSLVTVTDEFFKLSYCNNATEKLLGIKKEELIGKNPELFFTPSQGLSLTACVTNAKSSGNWAGELKTIDANGNTVYLNSNINTLYDSKNNLRGCFAVHSNVTQLKLAQEKAEKLSAQLSSLNNQLNQRVQEQTLFITEVFSRINEDFIGTDNNYIITYAHAANFFKNHKIVEKETNLLNLLTNITTQENVNRFKNAFDAQQAAEFEINPTGQQSWFKVSVNPTPTGLSVYFIDITKDKASAFQLEKLKNLYSFTSQLNEMMLRSVSEIAIFAGICKLTAELDNIIFSVITLYEEESDTLTPIQWSGNGGDYLKYIAAIKPQSTETGNGPIGHVIRTGDYYYCNDLENDPDYTPWRSHAAKRGYKSSIALPIKNQEKVFAILSMYASVANFFSDAELVIVLRIMENINYAIQNFAVAKERKKAKEDLLLISNAVDQSHTPVMISDLQRNIVYANRAFSIRAAMPVQQLLGRNIKEIRPMLYLSGPNPTTLEEKLFKENRWKGEFYSKDNDGREMWEIVNISAIRDDAGDVTHFTAISEDITERKKLEIDEKKLTIDLMQSNRSLKQFSYALSHYIRAPLSNILAFKELLQENMPGEEQKFAFDSMIKAAEQIDNIIMDITAILHQQQATPEQLEEISFERVMKRVGADLTYMIDQKHATIKTNFEKAESIVTIRSYIKSIFSNIMLNAMQYAKPGSEVLLEIWTEKQDGNILIHFKDYGQGIDLEKNKKDIFGLYKRFNFSVPGKGLGLYSVKTQVDYLGGDITVKSQVNGWTEFIITLPDNAM